MDIERLQGNVLVPCSSHIQLETFIGWRQRHCSRTRATAPGVRRTQSSSTPVRRLGSPICPNCPDTVRPRSVSAARLLLTSDSPMRFLQSIAPTRVRQVNRPQGFLVRQQSDRVPANDRATTWARIGSVGCGLSTDTGGHVSAVPPRNRSPNCSARANNADNHAVRAAPPAGTSSPRIGLTGPTTCPYIPQPTNLIMLAPSSNCESSSTAAIWWQVPSLPDPFGLILAGVANQWLVASKKRNAWKAA